MNRFANLCHVMQLKLRLPSFILVSIVIATTAFLGNPLIAQAASTPVTSGFRDFSYPVGTGGNSSPTGDKPESKLWWNDGLWWGILWSTSGNAYHIYKLDWPTQTWLDTGTVADDRIGSRADALWDGQHLYVVSHIFAENAAGPAPAGQRGELFRYGYNAGTKSYSLDSGYPIEVTLGKSETLVLEKDSTGRLWITYVESKKVMVAHSTTSDNLWGAPYLLPVTDASGLTSDDISSLITFDGRVGVMWSNHTTQKMYFATHLDNDQDTVWQSVSIYAPAGAAADDHINLKSLQTDNAGNVFAVLKTSFSSNTSPLINLLVCSSGTGCTSAVNWRPYMIYSKQDHHTRAILLIDTTNRVLNVFSSSPESGGIIYRKSTSIDNIQFATGHGTPFIQSSTDSFINDATSTKQNVNVTTGLVVLASDDTTKYYLHNCLVLTNPEGSCDSPGLTFSSPTYTVIENGGTALITVNLNKAQATNVTVNYATSDGTATAGSDYSATSGSLTFTPGQTSKTFTVPILEDALDENAETINLTLSSPSNALLGEPATATLTITDNDNPPTVQFSNANYSSGENGGAATVTATLSAASGMTVTVNYASSNGTATGDSDYTPVNSLLTFNPGEISKSFVVPILQDGVDESDETVNLALTNPSNATLGAPALATLTLVDDDLTPTVQFSSGNYQASENGGTATITATLSAPSSLPITVNYATSNGTATAGSDYTTASALLTFAAGQTSKTFTVPILQDAIAEGNETVNLALINPTNATLGAPATAILTILDDDSVPTVQWSAPNYSVHEQAGTAIITATLSAAAGQTVTVHYVTSNGTATAGSDYGATSGTLSFSPGETSKPISVAVMNDTLDENDETLSLTLSNPGQATLGAPATATVTVVDDDNPPTVRFGSGSYSVGEQGGTAPITVQLSGASGLPVTVHYATSNGTATAGSDYAATSGTVTFNPGQTNQSFAVPIVQDNVAELNETVNLALSNPAQATLGTPASAVLTIVDDDIPAATPIVQFSAASYTYAEAGGLATFTVTLSAASEQAVTVAYATTDGTALAGSDYTAASGVLTFAPGKTSRSFTLPLLDDNLDEEDETASLSLSQATGAILVGNTSATLTISDDDAPPLVQFGAATYTVTTDSSVAVVEVKLSAASGKVVTVHYTTNPALTVAGATAGTVQFNPGETSQTVTIPLVPTGSSGPATTLTVALDQAANATVGGVSATTVEISAASSAKIYLPLVSK